MSSSTGLPQIRVFDPTGLAFLFDNMGVEQPKTKNTQAETNRRDQKKTVQVQEGNVHGAAVRGRRNSV